MVNIGPGIEIGPGITIEATKTPYTDMRNLLSVSGKSAYDAAASGDLFAVSQADYEAVEGNVADAYIRGSHERASNITSWVSGYGYISAPYETICYAGGKIIGMTWKFNSLTATATVNLSTSTSYHGTYANQANNIARPVAGGTTRRYYLRKEAPDEASNVFSIVKTNSNASMTSGAAASIGYYTASYTSGGFSAFPNGSNQPNQFIYILPSNIGLVTNGLLMNLVANSRTSVLFGSTSTWRDISGNNNTPTSISSNVTLNSFPAHYSLNGSNQYFNAGSSMLSENASFTKEAWIYRVTTTSGRNIMSSLNAPFWFNGNTFSAGVGGNYSVVTESNVTTTNSWMHVAVTWDHATQTMTLYRAGTQVAQTVTSGLGYNSGEPIYLGAHMGAAPTYTPVSFFSGRFGEMRLYNRALTSAEITQNYNASKTVMGQ